MAFKEVLTQLTTSTTNLADNFNKVNNELLENDKYIKQQLEDSTTDLQDQLLMRPTQDVLDNEVRALEVKLMAKVENTTFAATKTALETKNTEQDTAIDGKVSTTTFNAAKTALETADTNLQSDINTRVQKTAYATDKAALENAIAAKTTSSLNGTPTNVNLILSPSGETVESLNGKKFASNTDIVKDRTGRTTEQVNRVFYKNMCKEFTSNGEAITVNNGMDGYVLSGKIEGQTVKNYLQSYTDITAKNWISNNVVKYLSDGYFESTSIYQGRRNTELLDTTLPLKLIMDISVNTLTTNAILTSANANTVFAGTIEVGFTGRKIFSLNTASVARDYLFYFTPKTGEKLVYRFMVVHENDVSKCTGWFDGLGSTQAIISNNNMKYSFYFLPEDKASGNVIRLGSVNGVYDTLEIKEDASVVYTQNGKDGLLTSGLTWTKASASGTSPVRFTVNLTDIKTGADLINVLSDTLKSVKYIDVFNGINRGISNLGINPGVSISLPELDNMTLEEFKIWLGSGVKIRYQLVTPIVTTIDKSLVPTILTQATNTFTFGEGVAPYSATIQVPCTDDIKKSYDKLVLFNGYTQTAGTATPVVNLLNTGLVRLQMDLTAPTTLLNATLFAVAPELRPVTNAKIPIFVNGVCVLGVVDKTTGNVNLPSIPSANSNIYIKTDYRRDI